MVSQKSVKCTHTAAKERRGATGLGAGFGSVGVLIPLACSMGLESTRLPGLVGSAGLFGFIVIGLLQLGCIGFIGSIGFIL